MKDFYDIIIIGAGPSGSYLASNLNSSVGSVLIVDKRIGEDNLIIKEKACSGLVALNAQPFLSQMLSEDTNNVLAQPDKLKIRIIDAGTKRIVEQKDIIYNINRHIMEQNLFSSIPQHVSKVQDSLFLDYKEISGGLKEVKLVVNGQPAIVKTNILIGADGAKSRIRKKVLGKAHDSITKYTGIEWFLESDQDEIAPYFNIIIDKRLTDYYLWAFPKNGRLLIGGVFKGVESSKEIPKLFIDDLKELNIIRNDDVKIVKMWAHPILRPLKKKDLISHNNTGVYLIGEASGLICPTSAEGYSYAFNSGLVLSKFLNNETNSFIDKESERRVYNKVFRKKIIYNELIRSIYMLVFGKKY